MCCHGDELKKHVGHLDLFSLRFDGLNQMYQ